MLASEIRHPPSFHVTTELKPTRIRATASGISSPGSSDKLYFAEVSLNL